jgi:hypothetical protein
MRNKVLETGVKKYPFYKVAKNWDKLCRCPRASLKAELKSVW